MRPDAPTDLLRLPAGIDLDAARLIDRLQRDLPLNDRPFADVAAELQMSEPQVIDQLGRLLGSGVLTRFGPLYHIERAGGQFILAALQVPDERYGEVTQQVNALPEVAHNYRRDHALNMWFVVAAETPEAAWAACDQIEAATGLPVHAFPKEREYFVGLYLPLLSAAPGVAAVPPRATPAPAPQPTTLTDFDRQLIAATQAGMPLVPRPYEAVAAVLRHQRGRARPAGRVAGRRGGAPHCRRAQPLPPGLRCQRHERVGRGRFRR